MKAGLQPGAMMAVLAQFSQDDLVTRRRLRRAAALLSGGATFASSLAPVMPEDDRLAVEVAEKAGRLDDTLLSRAKMHYDRHLHRLKQLVTWFNISTMVAIAVVCFGLVMTVAWPALSLMGGTKNPLGSLGLGGQDFASPSAPPPARRAPGLSPEEEKTRAFNEEHGARVSGFIRSRGAQPQGGETAGQPEEREPAKPKKLQPKIGFGSPTPIQPTKIGN